MWQCKGQHGTICNAEKQEMAPSVVSRDPRDWGIGRRRNAMTLLLHSLYFKEMRMWADIPKTQQHLDDRQPIRTQIQHGSLTDEKPSITQHLVPRRLLKRCTTQPFTCSTKMYQVGRKFDRVFVSLTCGRCFFCLSRHSVLASASFKVS